MNSRRQNHLRGAFGSLLVGLAAVSLAGCNSDDSSPENGNRWASLGEVPAAASTRGDHTPLVVSEGEVFVGTREGVWRRSLSGSFEWAASGPEELTVLALRADPENPDVLLAGGEPHAFDQPTFYRSEDRGRTWTPAIRWYQPPRPEESVPIYGLAVLPGNSQVLYATVNADLALSSDGGMTWELPDGRTEEFFGYPCVIAITPTEPMNFLSGCEQPLDFAHIGSHRLDPAHPFDFTQPGTIGASTDQLSNRRPNAFAFSSEQPDTVYAGVEGGLLAMHSDGTLGWVFKGGEPYTPWPYAYITAIWVDPDDAEHLIFGGKPNANDARLSLFETGDRGVSIEMIDPPETFRDPAVVQIAPSGEGDLIVMISDGDGTGEDLERRVLIYRLAER